jgi:hypothetical protein
MYIYERNTLEKNSRICVLTLCALQMTVLSRRWTMAKQGMAHYQNLVLPETRQGQMCRDRLTDRQTDRLGFLESHHLEPASLAAVGYSRAHERVNQSAYLDAKKLNPKLSLCFLSKAFERLR